MDRLGSFLGASWLVFGPPSRLSGADDPPRAAPGNPGESRPARPGTPPLQIDRIRLPGEGFGEGEVSHTPMIPKGSADLKEKRSVSRL